MTLYKNKYRIESTRLQKWDYGWNAKYFITIVTKNRENYFGEIANKFWFEIPVHFPFVILDEFIVMPNHIHGIVIINKKRDDTKLSDNDVGCGGGDGDNDGDDGGDDGRDKACLVSTATTSQPPTEKLTPGQKRFRNPGKNNISSIFGSYKSVVSNNAHKINPDFDWQSRFYDHIIRDEKELNRIRNYIRNNPKNWFDDKFYK